MRIACLLLLLFLTNSCAEARQKKKLELEESYQKRLLQSLEAGTDYATTVLLDSTGTARGDYDLVRNEWVAYESAWHTGQAIQGLLAAYAVTGNQKALNSAIKAGDWWVSLQFPEGHALAGYLNAIHGGSGPKASLINTTTITDGTPGLFLLSELTKDPDYAQTATDAGQFILEKLYLPEHQLSYNMVSPETGEILTDYSPHEQHQDLPVTINMVARPNAEGYLWKDMYEFTGQSRYKEAFLELCDGLLEKQSANGFWMDFEPNDPLTGKIHARFNTWNAEALLEAYELTQDQKYLSGALKTAKGLVDIQQKNGAIYYLSYTDGSYSKESPCGSGTSFAGILWLRLYELGHQQYQKPIIKALDFTLLNQFPTDHPDPNLAGAYFEIRQKSKKNGKTKLLVRDIATTFGLRFVSQVYQNAFADE